MKIFLLLLFSLCAYSAFAQNISYTKNYDSGGGVDNGNAVAAFNTSEYYLIGNTNITPNLDIHLVKVDATTGTMLWAKQYDSGAGSLMNDDGTDITPISNGFLLTGSVTKEFLPADKDAFLVKVDTAGTVIWQKTIGGANVDVTRAGVMLADSSFILTGYTTDITLTGGTNANDVYILKIDKDGNILNQKAFGGISNDEGFGITATSDGGAIVVGSYADASQLYVLKIKNDGDTVWTRRLGSTITTGYSVVENPDNSIAICGEENVSGSKFVNVRLLDQNGNELWNQNIRPSGFSSASGKSIIRTQNGYLITGQLDNRWMLMRCDLNGDTVWTTAGPSGSSGTDILWDSNGDYLITGSLPDNNTDFMLIKAFDCKDITVTCSDSADVSKAFFTSQVLGGHPAYTYTWSGDAGFSSTLPNPDFTYPGNGSYSYQLIVTDNRGCSDTCGDTVVINIGGLGNLNQGSVKVSVFPNPFGNAATFTIEGSTRENLQVAICNLLGENLLQFPVDNSGSFTMSRNNLPPGIYFYYLTRDHQQLFTGKLIIE